MKLNIRLWLFLFLVFALLFAILSCSSREPQTTPTPIITYVTPSPGTAQAIIPIPISSPKPPPAPSTSMLIVNSAEELVLQIQDFPVGWQVQKKESKEGGYESYFIKPGIVITFPDVLVNWIRVYQSLEEAKKSYQEFKSKIVEKYSLGTPRIADESFNYAGDGRFEVYFRKSNIIARVTMYQNYRGSIEDSVGWAKKLADKIERVKRLGTEFAGSSTPSPNVLPIPSLTPVIAPTPTYSSTPTPIPTPTPSPTPMPPNLTLFNPQINGLIVTINGISTPGTSGSTIMRIHFDWDDGSLEDQGFSASHTYRAGGSYQVNVTSYQSDGLSSSKELTLNIVPSTPKPIQQAWIRQFGTSGEDKVNSIAIDSLGNIYVAGHTDGNLFGPSNLGMVDAFLRKYDSTGSIAWTRRFGSKGADEASSMAIDSSDNMLITGSTSGELPGQRSYRESQDAFLRKYDSFGNDLWTRQFGYSPHIYGDSAAMVAVDKLGNIYLVGNTWGQIPGQTYLGDSDVFLRKYDSAGSEILTRQFGSSGRDVAYAIAIDKKDAIYVAGYTSGILHGQTGSGGNFDAFLRKYDSSGNEIWTRQFGSSSYDEARSIAIDNPGNIYVVGRTAGALPGQIYLGDGDAFLKKYDSNGNEIWTRQFGTSFYDKANSVAIDSSDYIYIAGSIGGALPDQISNDAFLRKYDSSGNEIWTRQFGSFSYDEANSVAVDNSGNIYVAGYAVGALPGQTSLERGDAFLIKLVQ